LFRASAKIIVAPPGRHDFTAQGEVAMLAIFLVLPVYDSDIERDDDA
jgi:hypothetical protein